MRSFFILLFLLYSTLAPGQSQVNFEYYPEGHFEKELKTSIVKASLYQADRSDSFNLYKEFEFPKGKNEFSLTSVPKGIYRIELETFVYPDVKLPKHMIYIFSGLEFPISGIGLNTVKIQFPLTCEYYEHVYDKICPKCKRTDKVVPIMCGIPVEHDPGSFSKDDCQIASCSPYWYCTRDKKGF